MTYVIEGIGCLVDKAGEEQPLKAGDFALVNPDEKHPRTEVPSGVAESFLKQHIRDINMQTTH